MSVVKLRASYSIVGNDGDTYLTTATCYYIFSNPFDNPCDGSSYPYYAFDSNALPNMDLKPEKQHSLELGLDMRFLHHRLGFALAWYKTNTNNPILAVPLAPETGVSSRDIYAGNIQNHGIEFLITGTPVVSKECRWELSFIIPSNLD